MTRTLGSLLGALAGTLTLALALAACGDNHDTSPDGRPADGAPPSARAVIAAGDFMPGAEGVLSALRFDPPAVDQRVAPSGAIGNDPLLRRIGGELYVVNRAEGNNVTILDEATFAVKAQLATGAGSNPQDVAAVGDTLFVPALGTAGVVAVARGTGARETIDLSALDPDGRPDCVSAYAVGGEVYVACGLLDDMFRPRGPGQIAVIDAATRAVKTTFPLANANPFGALAQLPAGVLGGDLVVPTVPNLYMGDATAGCLERIRTGPAPSSNGCVVMNAQLGGYVARATAGELGGAHMLWLIASRYDTEARGELWGYDLDTGSLWPSPISPPTQVLVDVAACPGDAVVVADQTMASNGLRIYRGTSEETAAAMPVGLRPGSSHGLACYE